MSNNGKIVAERDGKMNFDDKLIKQITETAYLNEENSYRYRPIMRFFYYQYEQANNWLFKEDIYEQLKDKIPNYTLEDCQRDLDFLVAKLSLTTVQDIENANTIDKFKYKNYRYQMTDYAIEIERMTINLEEMEVKVSSLEPRLFERIKNILVKLTKPQEYDESKLYELWSDLIQDFKNLNQSYHDFLKKFNEPKTEELLQSTLFIEHKNRLIKYLEDFIKEYLKYSSQISQILVQIDEEKINFLMDSLINYQKKAPKLRPDFDFDYLRKTNYGKFISLKKWFYNEFGISEGERLLQATNRIIAKITKYAANLIELHGNMIHRKEEYKHLCYLFDNIYDLNKANELASTVIGVTTIRHFKGISNLMTDSIIPSYDVEPILINIEPMRRRERINREREIIKDKTLEKEKLLKEYLENEKKEREALKKFIKQQKITLIGEVKLSFEERRFLFKILEKIDKLEKNVLLKGVDPVFGYDYNLIIKDDVCKIKCSDGDFLMNELIIEFLGDMSG